MAVGALDRSSAPVRPPLAVAWVVIIASALAVIVVGVLATGLVFVNIDVRGAVTPSFWIRLAVACLLTLFSVSLRGLRWVFLLRRSETRIPIRDAYIGYFAGLSLLVAPLLLGEIAVRATINRARGGVPFLTTAVVNVWERALDAVALGTIAASAALLSGDRGRSAMIGFAVLALSLVAPLRRLGVRATASVLTPCVGLFEGPAPAVNVDRLAKTRTWAAALGVSIVAWLLPGMSLWLLAGERRVAIGWIEAERLFARAAVAGTAYLSPGGVLVAGPDMLSHLLARGMDGQDAALAVLGVRLATVGISIVLGWVFVAWHLRSARAASATHFDDIADAYDVQIPEARRHALLDVKTRLMREALDAGNAGRRGLDVGCGQGAYVARMRALGFDVRGIDASPGQIRLAARNLDDPAVVQVGSVLDIPAADQAFDFVYVINVLHHLDSVEQQRRAFAELFRTLKPGGLLFVHEINTRNVLFRFYMGYVFPSLNCIDEGVERWLRPDRLSEYTGATVRDIRYFTFLPDFLSGDVVRLLGPLERWLESSRLRVYSAHYMATIEKSATGPG